MIRHIVLFSARDAEDVAEIRHALQRMAAIAGAHRFEVTYNAKRDKLSRQIDVVLYSEFESWEALDAYQSHPVYEATTQAVRPLRDQRVVADSEIPEHSMAGPVVPTLP